MRVLSVFGTRPEVIKMVPIVLELAARDGIESFVCVSAQRRNMPDQVRALFEIDPEFDLDIMTHGQTLEDITTAVRQRIIHVLKYGFGNVVVNNSRYAAHDPGNCNLT